MEQTQSVAEKAKSLMSYPAISSRAASTDPLCTTAKKVHSHEVLCLVYCPRLAPDLVGKTNKTYIYKEYLCNVPAQPQRGSKGQKLTISNGLHVSARCKKKEKKKKNHICTEKIALVKLQVGEISDANCCVSEHWALC